MTNSMFTQRTPPLGLANRCRKLKLELRYADGKIIHITCDD
ncbi:hypothetical protein [Iningainema tapete]|nr:hypothetical protein [Iningainema tapete]